MAIKLILESWNCWKNPWKFTLTLHFPSYDRCKWKRCRVNILSNISFGVPQKKETLWVWNNTRSEQMMRRGEDGPMGSTDLLCSSLKTRLPLQTPPSLLSGATGVMMFLGHRTHLQYPTVHPCINVTNTTKQYCVWVWMCARYPCCPPSSPLYLQGHL